VATFTTVVSALPTIMPAAAELPSAASPTTARLGGKLGSRSKGVRWRAGRSACQMVAPTFPFAASKQELE